MTRLTTYLVAAAVVTSVVRADASPLPLGPVGHKCALVVTRQANVESGTMSAGPLYAAEPGTLYCSIHLNNGTHSGSAVAAYAFPATNGVVFGTAPAAYFASEQDDVVVCTRWSGASGTLYWHDPNPSVPTDPGSWSFDPGTSCAGFPVRVPIP